MSSFRALLCLPILALGLAACHSAPRQSHVQWVARDAWNADCADKAIVERWVADNGHWKIKGEVWVVDVDATFKLGNDCKSGLLGKSFKAYESVSFQKDGLEMSRCKRDGEDGWSLPGKESERCWTGPTLLPAGK